MGNITENKLNTTIVAADITAITTALGTVATKLPVISLTDEQRQNLKGIDVNNKVFVQDAITEIGASGAGILPPFINATFIQNDLTLYDQIDGIESQLNNLLQRVSDIKRVTGDEAYTSALAVYKIFDGASQSGIMNAKQPYERLRMRFESQGRPAEEDNI